MLLMKFVLPLLLLLSNVTHADEDWTLARDSSAIKVWTRRIPDYPIRGFKAITVVKSSLSGLIALIMDTERADQWIYRTMQVDVLKRDDEKATFVIRVVTDFPWPLSNRDAIVAGRITQDEKTGTVVVSSRSLASPQYPVRDDFVRMPDIDGSWTFRPLSNGFVEVTMQGRADPGGSIPAAVVNMIIHETPYRTLLGLRRVISDRRYQGASVSKISEPQP
ncbi:MAG: START domain-containing protein [bacterium]|nr:START domain-containing protein [bacterium]